MEKAWEPFDFSAVPNNSFGFAVSFPMGVSFVPYDPVRETVRWYARDQIKEELASLSWDIERGLTLGALLNLFIAIFVARAIGLHCPPGGGAGQEE